VPSPRSQGEAARPAVTPASSAKRQARPRAMSSGYGCRLVRSASMVAGPMPLI
jgi:hypothetical protein